MVQSLGFYRPDYQTANSKKEIFTVRLKKKNRILRPKKEKGFTCFYACQSLTITDCI